MDAVHNTDFDGELKDFSEPVACHYVGYLARNDEKFLVLISEISPNENEGRYSMTIPSNMVQKVEILWSPKTLNG